MVDAILQVGAEQNACSWMQPKITQPFAPIRIIVLESAIVRAVAKASQRSTFTGEA
mgnify:CR=1 FL=1